MKKKKKKVLVSLDPDVRPAPVFHQFMITSTEDGMIIDLADSEESEDEIQVNVKRSFVVPANKMRNFTTAILKELILYEEKYHNGYGLPKP